MGEEPISQLGSILGIWAHPDDEAYLSAGLMMHAVERGDRVTLVTATKGEAGFPDEDERPMSERMRIREAELAACLALLGVTEHRWLGYADGHCAEQPDDEMSDLLVGIIDDVQPDTILTFGPEGITGHADHIAVCRWTTLAWERASHRGAQLLYATKTHSWREDFFRGMDLSDIMMVEGLDFEVVEESDLAVFFSCDAAHLERKVAALRAQASQIEPLAQQLGLARFAAMTREECFRAPTPEDPALIERARTLGA